MMTESKELRVSGRTDLGGKLWKIGKTTCFLEPDTEDNSRDTEAKCKRFYSCCSEKKRKKEKERHCYNYTE
jgi:hypothetical protein